MFDYEKFAIAVAQQMTVILDLWAKENDDIYIFSLDCAKEMNSIGVMANTNHYLAEQASVDAEDYFYYKYCEEEWDLFHTFEQLSADMNHYCASCRDVFIHPQTHEYTEAFYEHSDKIIGCCQKALICFRQQTAKRFQDMLLTFNMGEEQTGQQRIEQFNQINSVSAAQEYAQHVDDFA